MTDLEIELTAALSAASGYLLNAKIDLESGCKKATAIRTIEGGLKIVAAALEKVGNTVTPHDRATEQGG